MEWLQAIEPWLRSTVPGIIVLGAVGSIVAALAWKAVSAPSRKLWEWARRKHLGIRIEQAFWLGAHHAHSSLDETGRELISFLAYRVCRFVAALLLLCTDLLALLIFLTNQKVPAATGGTVAASTLLFLTAYWAHYEWEPIYRTYLFHWKGMLEGINDQAPNKQPPRRISPSPYPDKDH